MDLDFKLEDCIRHLLHDSEKAISSAITKNFFEHGYNLTSDQWAILTSLWEKDGQCQYELAQKHDKDKASITRLINNMEKNNWVVRITSEKDKRIKLIYLTFKAKSQHRQLMELAFEIIQRAVDGIPSQELEITKNVLKKIRGNLSS